jgi:hypothetical protein
MAPHSYKSKRPKVVKGWAIIMEGDDPRMDRWWRGFDVYRTRAAAERCMCPGEKIKRVEVRFR